MFSRKAAKPKVTVAVVCFNEERNIQACLSSLLRQSFGSKNYQILVVDNNSTDGTQKLVKKLAQSVGNLKMVVNPKRGIAASRNVALKQAKTELLAFTDADAEVPQDWLGKLVTGYLKYKKKDPRVVAVGGGNRPPATTRFYQALGIMLDTYLGSRGSVQAKSYPKDMKVPHLPCVNVIYQKAKVEEMGGFDERLGSIIEDEDLSYRLRARGYRLVYLAGTEVVHKMRANFISWAKRMLVYGQGRIWFLQKHQLFNPIFTLPVILVLSSPISFPFYLALVGFYSFWLVLKAGEIRLFTYVVVLYIMTHYFYGLGEILGIFKPYKRT